VFPHISNTELTFCYLTEFSHVNSSKTICTSLGNDISTLSSTQLFRKISIKKKTLQNNRDEVLKAVQMKTVLKAAQMKTVTKLQR
jgi:thermostable 8-oxoguanine DNA glycosylase